MTTTVIANGNTYTDDDNPDTGMGEGGFRIRLLPMLSDVMHDINIGISSTSASADAAAASATTAINAPGTAGTSTTSMSVALGNHTFTTQTGKNFIVGMWVTIASTASPATQWMNGAITAYNSGTGSMTVNVSRFAGNSTLASWNISLSAPGAYLTGGLQYVAPAAPSPGISVNSATDLRYQYMLPGSCGTNITLAGSSTNTPGPALVTLRNAYAPLSNNWGYDSMLLSGVGDTLGYLAPDKEATINGNPNSPINWDVNGMRAYGSEAMAKVVFASAVAGTSGVYVKSLALVSSGPYTLLLLHGASLHAVIYDASAGQFGTPLLIRASMSAAGEDGSVMATPMLDGSGS